MKYIKYVERDNLQNTKVSGENVWSNIQCVCKTDNDPGIENLSFNFGLEAQSSNLYILESGWS